MKKQWLLLIMILVLGGCDMQNRFLYFPNDDRPTAAMLVSGNMAFWRAASGLQGADFHGERSSAIRNDRFVSRQRRNGF